ncbi:MAG: hypothetical protein ACI4PE_03885 [Bacilli bacterium]
MEKTKYYRVEIPGMIYGEDYKLELPNVIERKRLKKDTNGESFSTIDYINTPVYAELIDGNLYELITGELIKTNSLSKKTICQEPELVALNIEEVSANRVMGDLSQIQKQDVIRYKEQLENLKKVCLKVYRKGSREMKKITEIQEYGYYLFKDIIEEYKNELIEEDNKKKI